MDRWPVRREESLLAGLTVVVDGSGPDVEVVGSSLRTVGMGRVLIGRYAAEPPLWSSPGDRPVTPVEDVAAVVFVRTGPLEASVAAPWWACGATVLPVTLCGPRAEVGPLIVPGLSSCARCHELVRLRPGRPEPGRPPESGRRSDAAGGSASGSDRAGVLFAAAIAALTLRMALRGDRDLVGVSSEVHAERPEVLHRYWPRQPDCPCVGAPGARGVPAVTGPTSTQWTMGA